MIGCIWKILKFRVFIPIHSPKNSSSNPEKIYLISPINELIKAKINNGKLNA